MTTAQPVTPEPTRGLRQQLAKAAAREAELLIENERLRGQHGATGEILRLIAGAARGTGGADGAQEVLDSIAQRASELVRVRTALVQLVEGDRLRIRAAARGGQQLDAAPGSPGARRRDEGQPLANQAPSAVAVRERRLIHVPDIEAEEARYPAGVAAAREANFRSVLVVPLLRGNEAIGAVSLTRVEPEPFNDYEIALVRSFADQAVIAIENARLFSELQERLSEQGATNDILRAIAASPTDVQPVLQAVADSCVRLCRADDSILWRVASRNPLEVVRVARGGATIPAASADPMGQRLTETTSAHYVAIAQRRNIHLPDLTEAAMRAEGVGEWFAEHQRSRGVGAFLAVPLLTGGEAEGLIVVRRKDPGPFTAQEISVLESFASQAAIAIKNAALFSELQQSNRTLADSLAQQTATAEVLQAISRAAFDLQSVLDTLVRNAVTLTGADIGVVLRAESDCLAVWAHHGASDAFLERITVQPVRYDRATTSGRAATERRVVRIDDVLADPEYQRPDMQRSDPYRSTLAVPLLRGNELLGVITVWKRPLDPFTDRQVDLIRTFADQVVIAIENARLFSELNETNASLNEALEQQTATSEVLATISRSPTDLEGVLDTICASAARLCACRDALILRADGDALIVVAATGAIFSGALTAARAGSRTPLGVPGLSVTAFRERRTIHVADMQGAEGDPFRVTQQRARDNGGHTYLAVPLLREGEAIGAITVSRGEVRPFSDDQVRLLRTFADQAVIAIENARLFSELRERDERRRQELERAAIIQQRLLPETVEGWPGLLELAVRFLAAVETSGDFYDVLRLTPSPGETLPPLQIAVGDVAGKGMSAALVTALARSALRSTAAVPTDLATPANTLRLAGRRLHADVGGSHFVACALAVIEPPGTHHAGPRLRLANAAQVPVLLVRGGRAVELEPPGYRLPLGAQDVGDYKDVETDLARGDVVVFSSDGLVEAPSLPNAVSPRHLAAPEQHGELFGFARLASSAAHWARHAHTAEAVAAGIWSDLTAWCGDESHHDDVTLLVLRVPEAYP